MSQTEPGESWAEAGDDRVPGAETRELELLKDEWWQRLRCQELPDDEDDSDHPAC